MRLLAVLSVFAACGGIGVWVSGAFAAPGKSVMLIQVSGLEPKDVTPETTPFLWALGHSNDLNIATKWPRSAAFTTAPGLFLNGRPGFTYQAARGVMQASTAPNVVSLLTGAYPEQTAVPSDAFYTGTQENGVYSMDKGDLHRLGVVDGFDRPENAVPIDGGVLDISGFQSLFEMVNPDGGGKKTAAFIGDPALAPLVVDDTGFGQNITGGLSWKPEPYVEPGSPTSPATPGQDHAPPVFCPVPRDPGDVVDASSDAPGPQRTEAAQGGCVAPDFQTLHRGAFDALKANANNFPAFTYIYLAEVGAIKRLTADLDGPGTPDANAPSTAAPMSVPDALHETDTALATFFGRINNQSEAQLAAEFQDMTVIVVGDHGYEQALPNKRIPDPTSVRVQETVDVGEGGGGVAIPKAADAETESVGRDLAAFVKAGAGVPGLVDKFELVPQGTMATIYPKVDFPSATGEPPDTAANPTQAHRDAIARLKKSLEEGVGDEIPPVNDICRAMADGGDCIREIVYTRPQLAPTPDDLDEVLGGDRIPQSNPNALDPEVGAHVCSAFIAPENPDFAQEGGVTLPDRPACSSWHLDHNGFDGDVEIVKPSGVGGDLVVQLEPGWSVGKLEPTVQQATLIAGESGGGETFTNPHLASDGSPRNRPIAAIVNGPGVRQLDTNIPGGRYPVFKQDPAGKGSNSPDPFDPNCLGETDLESKETHRFPSEPLAGNASAQTDPTKDGVIAANSAFNSSAVDPPIAETPDHRGYPNGVAVASLDDPDALGYHCQAEIVDFAPTIASILGVNMPGNQIQGRLLHEAIDDLPDTALCADCGHRDLATFFAEPFDRSPISQTTDAAGSPSSIVDGGPAPADWESFTGSGGAATTEYRAQVPAQGTSHHLRATNLGLNVPGDATVVGVKVEVGRTASRDRVRDDDVRLIKDGAVEGSNRADTATAWPLTLNKDNSAFYGSEIDLWGTTLTPGDVNRSNFGVAIAARNGADSGDPAATAAVKTIKVTVVYETVTQKLLWASKTATFGFYSSQPTPPGVKFWCRFDFDSNTEADWYRCGQKRFFERQTKSGPSRVETLGSTSSAALATTCPDTSKNPPAPNRFRCDWPIKEKVGKALSVGRHTFEVCAEARSKHPHFDPTDSTTWPKGMSIDPTDSRTWPAPTPEYNPWSVEGFDPKCADQTATRFTVIPFFDFDGLLQRVAAFVTDKKGHPVQRTTMLVDRHGFAEQIRRPAARRAMLDHLAVRADFGKTFNKVQLSLYRQIKLRKACRGRKTCLDTLAKFPPFAITRGPVDLLFKIPSHFKGIRTPTHVGMIVQEYRLINTSKRSECRNNPNKLIGPRTRRRPLCRFRAVGGTKGDIVPIRNANLLHKRNR